MSDGVVSVGLNPYSDGIRIEQVVTQYSRPQAGLNPYSIGIRIEHVLHRIWIDRPNVLILILLEYG